jgi:tetratricopeptide (TPR) repeat protein
LAGSALLAALTVAWVSTGLAEDRVGIRASEYDGYARFVFDWPEPVAFAAATRGRNLWVRFDRSFHSDPAAIAANLSRYVAGVRLAEDRKGLDIVLTGAYRASSFAQGNEVVFELRPAETAAAAPRPAAFTDRSRAADSAAPTLPVRVGSHDTYLRLVFDWAQPVDYEVEETGAAVRLRFNRAARIDVAALRRRLPPEMAKLDAKSDGGALVLTLPRQSGRQVRHFRIDTKVVLDLVRDGAKAAAPPPSPAPNPPAATAAAAPKPTEEPAATAPAQPEKADPPSQEPPQKPVSSEAAEPPPPLAAPVPEVQQGAPKAADGGSANEGQADSEEKGVSLVFEWPEPVGAAVFQREPYVWVVFDKRAQLNLAALRDAGAAVVDLIEQLPVGSGTVVRMIPKKGLNPVVALEGSNWVVRFREAAISPQVPIAIRVRPEAEEGTQLELPVSEFGRIIRIPDPDVGDMIVATTLRAPGHGLAGQRRYPEFGLLASAQGVGIETFSDDLDVRDGGDRGLIISAPGGLHISSVSEGAEMSGSSFLGPRIFNLENWFRGRGEPFIAARQAMFEAVADAKEERRDDARLDLARFYFARGYGPEALGVLRTIEYANTDMASLPEFRAMKSAVLVYMGRAQEARKVLLDPSLDQYQEISLWRGSMLLQTGEAKKAAAHFRSGEPVLQTYPEPMKTKLAVELTEASLADLDLETATLWLDQLGQAADKMRRDQAARVLYDRGVLARDSRKLDEAVELWTKARKGMDRWAAAHAEHALVDLGLQQETIEPAEAIERLDRLRYQWRGDDLELKVLRRLGGLYLAQSDYRKGLNTLRTAVTYFPERDEVKEIAQTMAESFRKLHLGGDADRLPPLKALALYDDFRELTPAGPEGDLMIQRLADRLVAVDLLDRAASLLGHQIRFRLKGEERARVGAKLALIMLLDRNPKGALSALRNSFQPSLPLDLEDDRRRIRAKATMDIGRYEEAIALLAGDVSREADLLRAHLYWNTKDYSEAAKVLQRLSGDPIDEGAYPEEQARYILSWAVALQLKRDEAGVKMLRQLYGPGMNKSKLGDAFAYIASESPAGATDIEEMSQRIAEGDKFDAFLKNYRERLMSPIAVSPKDGKEMPAADADKGSPPADASPAAPSAAPAAIPPPPPPPRG